jgi:hypothetical protein
MTERFIGVGILVSPSLAISNSQVKGIVLIIRMPAVIISTRKIGPLDPNGRKPRLLFRR